MFVEFHTLWLVKWSSLYLQESTGPSYVTRMHCWVIMHTTYITSLCARKSWGVTTKHWAQVNWPPLKCTGFFYKNKTLTIHWGWIKFITNSGLSKFQRRQNSSIIKRIIRFHEKPQQQQQRQKETKTVTHKSHRNRKLLCLELRSSRSFWLVSTGGPEEIIEEFETLAVTNTI